MIVRRRCATHRTVVSRSCGSERSVRWIAASVAASREEVASSRMSTLGRWSSARASASSWRSPTEKFAPASSTRMSRLCPPANRDEASPPSVCPETSRSASRTSSSDEWPNGSTQSRSRPENRTGSCAMTAAARCRTVRRSSCESGAPSTRTSPASSGVSRKSAAMSELLPAPDRPQTPHRLPGGTRNESRSSASGSPGR
mmetsp:Transcript_27081/g.108404  ORF Transcript_27081/g.108404 Transcript_27081/m.108404 type:complete len:200 (-) Transcript_27081:561-1160(-)